MGLGLYVANMVKAIKAGSRDAEAQLANAGHPNAFPSKPVAGCLEWDLVQGMDKRTLLLTMTLNVPATDWTAAVRKLCKDVTGFDDLRRNLDTVSRTIHPTTHATVLLWPTQTYVRSMQAMSDMDAIAAAKAKGFQYEKCIIKGQMAGLNLISALDLLESFHVLEALPVKWGKNHLFKCNCELCFKNASCPHVVFASWVVDPTAGCPDRYLGTHFQRRRKRGRPSAKASEVGDAGEARCRARLSLQEQYKAPQV